MKKNDYWGEENVILWPGYKVDKEEKTIMVTEPSKGGPHALTASTHMYMGDTRGI